MPSEMPKALVHDRGSAPRKRPSHRTGRYSSVCRIRGRTLDGIIAAKIIQFGRPTRRRSLAITGHTRGALVPAFISVAELSAEGRRSGPGKPEAVQARARRSSFE